MAKNPTKWDNNDGATATPVDGLLLLENGNALLLEDSSGDLKLELVSLTLKEQTQWDDI